MARVRRSSRIALPNPRLRYSGRTMNERISAIRLEYLSKHPQATTCLLILITRQRGSFFLISAFVRGIRCSSSELTRASMRCTSRTFGFTTFTVCIVCAQTKQTDILHPRSVEYKRRDFFAELYGVICAPIVWIGHIQICDEKSWI